MIEATKAYAVLKDIRLSPGTVIPQRQPVSEQSGLAMRCSR